MASTDMPPRAHRHHAGPAWWIIVGTLAGLGGGALLHIAVPAAVAGQVANGADMVAELFLRLIRMIIAPLVFATLAGGIAGMGGASGTLRAGGLAIGWFVAASLVSLSLGLLAANLLHPGVGLPLVVPHAGAGIRPQLDARHFIVGLVPTSVLDAMARNDIVQIVVFASLFGAAAAGLPEQAAARVRCALSDLAAVMLRLTTLVMRLAPVAVFAAMLGSFARNGIGMAASLAALVGGFYATMLLLWLLLGAAGFLVLGRPVLRLLRMIAPALLLGFATASSEAVFPLLLERLERFGVPARVAGFVLPLGYAFNLDGGMLFQAFGALFIAQAYGIQLGIGRQVGMLLMLMVSSKGTAGVPRAAIVALAAVLPEFGLPDAGLLLLLGIDHLMDMGRTATNVIGNAIATAAVARRIEGGRRGVKRRLLDAAGGVRELRRRR